MPTLAEADDAMVRESMRRAGDNQRIAAGMLGIKRQALNRRLRLMQRRSPRPD
jgi:DNA-binding protein Fis